MPSSASSTRSCIVEDTFDFGPEFDALLQEALARARRFWKATRRPPPPGAAFEYARRSQSPSLNLSLSDTYQPDPAAFARQNVGAVTLGVTLPIFDGGLARERVREARGVRQAPKSAAALRSIRCR